MPKPLSPGAALAAMRKTRAGGRPKKLKKCPDCGMKLGAREMRAHKCGGPNAN